jgi:hypothetical protein
MATVEQLTQPHLAAGLIGVAAHQVVFRHGEWTGQAHAIIYSHAIALFAGLAAAFVRSYPIFEVFRVAGAYLAGLYGSMLIYRAFFHRLGSFPGPFAARLSRFYAFEKATRTNRSCEDVQKLHEQYGDFVRVGTSG